MENFDERVCESRQRAICLKLDNISAELNGRLDVVEERLRGSDKALLLKAKEIIDTRTVILAVIVIILQIMSRYM